MSLLAATLLALSPAATPAAAAVTPKSETRFCREMFKSSSRVHSVKVCKTRLEWRRWEACHASVTRYCTPRNKRLAASQVGRETPFPLNDDSRIICRLVKETGTRIVTQELCLPKREWDRMWVETSEGLRKIQGQHSTMTRSESADRVR